MTIYTICDTRIDCNTREQIKYDIDERYFNYYQLKDLLKDFIWEDTAICNKLVEVERKIGKALYKLEELEDRYIEEAKDLDLYNGLASSVDQIKEIYSEVSNKEYDASRVKDLLAFSEAQWYFIDIFLIYESSSCIDSICTSSEEEFNSKFKFEVNFFALPSSNIIDYVLSIPLNVIHDVYNNLDITFELLGEIEEYSCSSEALS